MAAYTCVVVIQNHPRIHIHPGPGYCGGWESQRDVSSRSAGQKHM